MCPSGYLPAALHRLASAFLLINISFFFFFFFISYLHFFPLLYLFLYKLSDQLPHIRSLNDRASLTHTPFTLMQSRTRRCHARRARPCQRLFRSRSAGRLALLRSACRLPPGRVRPLAPPSARGSAPVVLPLASVPSARRAPLARRGSRVPSRPFPSSPRASPAARLSPSAARARRSCGVALTPRRTAHPRPPLRAASRSPPPPRCSPARRAFRSAPRPLPSASAALRPRAAPSSRPPRLAARLADVRRRRSRAAGLPSCGRPSRSPVGRAARRVWRGLLACGWLARPALASCSPAGGAGAGGGGCCSGVSLCCSRRGRRGGGGGGGRSGGGVCGGGRSARAERGQITGRGGGVGWGGGRGAGVGGGGRVRGGGSAGWVGWRRACRFGGLAGGVSRGRRARSGGSGVAGGGRGGPRVGWSVGCVGSRLRAVVARGAVGRRFATVRARGDGLRSSRRAVGARAPSSGLGSRVGVCPLRWCAGLSGVWVASRGSSRIRAQGKMRLVW